MGKNADRTTPTTRKRRRRCLRDNVEREGIAIAKELLPKRPEEEKVSVSK